MEKDGNGTGGMSLWSVTSLGIGAMVGAGIFALLGQAVTIAGGATFVAFLLAGVVAQLSGYSYARLAARYPDSGGLTAFLDAGFGRGQLSGTVSVMFLVTLAISIAMVARGFGAYATALFVPGGGGHWVDIFACAIVLFFVVLNAASAGLVGRFELVLVAVKLVILAGLISAGGAVLATNGPVANPWAGPEAIVSAAGLIFMGYSGYGLMTNAAADVARPTLTIPRAIFLAITTVMILYVGLAIVVAGSVPPAEIARHADTAVAEAARPILGHAGFVVVAVGALLATASAINSCMFGAMQIALGLARNGQLPAAFGRTVWGSWTSGLLVVTAGLMVVMVVFDLSALAHISSATFLITYLAVHVAHWRVIGETRGSRPLVAIGALALAGLLGVFLWSMARAQPSSLAMVLLFVAGSWVTQLFVHRAAPRAA